MISIVILLIIATTGFGIALTLLKLKNQTEKEAALLSAKLNELSQHQQHWQQFIANQQHSQQQQRDQFNEYQLKSLQNQNEGIAKAMQDVRKQLASTLTSHTQQLNAQVERLTNETQQKLLQISNEVDKQLTKGFEKTTATFTDIVKRLTIIDQAQKRITELSSNVCDLQEILVDKRSRGAFGEVQLNALIQNMIPAKHVSFQHTLSNGKRADCVLLLPQPTGNVVIDSKFPLENYRFLNDNTLADSDRKAAEARFKTDIKKHVNDIADKYIIENETSDGAIMFLPAEAIFADLHAHHPDLVEYAQQKRVWIVSPTTLMAVITTAKAVLKDEATRKQVHVIRDHLIALGKDFTRFQKRMDNLSKHIDQAQEDVSLVHKSSVKIASRFTKIEQVEIAQSENTQERILQD